eukprot:663113-Rhodomonas_salina.2
MVLRHVTRTRRTDPTVPVLTLTTGASISGYAAVLWNTVLLNKPLSLWEFSSLFDLATQTVCWGIVGNITMELPDLFTGFG